MPTKEELTTIFELAAQTDREAALTLETALSNSREADLIVDDARSTLTIATGLISRMRAKNNSMGTARSIQTQFAAQSDLDRAIAAQTKFSNALNESKSASDTAAAALRKAQDDLDAME